jgi:hypothetical protein
MMSDVAESLVVGRAARGWHSGDVDTETRARRDNCHTFIHGDGLVRPAELLASIGDEVVPDVYGDGGVVADLELMVADLLPLECGERVPAAIRGNGIAVFPPTLAERVAPLRDNEAELLDATDLGTLMPSRTSWTKEIDITVAVYREPEPCPSDEYCLLVIMPA